MIQLHPDCLLIKMSNGESVPCRAEFVTAELIGDAVSWMSSDVVKNVAAAVLQYFRDDLGKTTVSVGEFSSVLERVLRQFGFSVSYQTKAGFKGVVEEAYFKDLLEQGELAFELAFYLRLRREMHRLLRTTPSVLKLHGLRGCVKQLLGARRWSRRCQQLNDQIVAFLRRCLDAEAKADCALVVMG